MVKSMTGFASHLDTLDSGAARFSCQWEMRAVNGRGLDLRFRLPDWLEGLESALRKRLSARLGRGNVTLSLRLGRADAGAALRLNSDALEAALTMLAETEARADARGFALAPISGAEVLALRGVVDQGPELTELAPLMPALMEQAEAVIDAFEAARAAEGVALAGILSGQIEAVAALLAEARAVLPARRNDQMQALRAALARLGEAAPQVEPARMEQELALIAMRGDITEELDRLDAHVTAARALITQENGPVGRKFDFLMQEFNREANTLCSKSQHAPLTRVGLDLKTVIDQMREQVQNLE